MIYRAFKRLAVRKLAVLKEQDGLILIHMKRPAITQVIRNSAATLRLLDRHFERNRSKTNRNTKIVTLKSIMQLAHNLSNFRHYFINLICRLSFKKYFPSTVL